MATAALIVAELEDQADQAMGGGRSTAMVTAWRKLREARTILREAEVELGRPS